MFSSIMELLFIALILNLHAIIETGIFFMTGIEFRNRNFMIASALIGFFAPLMFYLILGLNLVFSFSTLSVLFIGTIVVFIWLVKTIQYTILFGLSCKLLRTVVYANIASLSVPLVGLFLSIILINKK